MSVEDMISDSIFLSTQLQVPAPTHMHYYTPTARELYVCSMRSKSVPLSVVCVCGRRCVSDSTPLSCMSLVWIRHVYQSLDMTRHKAHAPPVRWHKAHTSSVHHNPRTYKGVIGDASEYQHHHDTDRQIALSQGRGVCSACYRSACYSTSCEVHATPRHLTARHGSCIMLHVTHRTPCHASHALTCNHNVIPLYEILIHIIIRFPSLNSLYPLPPSPPHTRTLLLYVAVLGVMQMECAGVRRVCNAGECMEFVSGRPPRSSPRQNTCTPSGQGVE